jgi:hypothetical protein
LLIGALCTGEKGVGKSGKKLAFEGSGFHRVIKGLVLFHWQRSLMNSMRILLFLGLCAEVVTSLPEMVYLIIGCAARTF